MKYVGTISLDRWPKPAIKRMVQQLDLHEAILGWETGQSGYRHCQFAIDCATDLHEFNTKNQLGWHIEDCISWDDAVDYCRKSGCYTYFGDSREEPEFRRITGRGNTEFVADIERRLKNQNDRQITVAIDRIGSSGKSTNGYLHVRRGDWFAVPRLESEPRR